MDAEGNLSVGYTITCPTSQSAPDFTIGIYGSPDGRQPVTLLQTFDVDDSNLLTGSTAGITHTATFPADLGDLDANGFVVAKLDAYDEVYETTKSDNVSTPLLGAFQTPQGDGNVYVYSTATNIDVSQDQQTGVLTVTVGGTTYSFSNVGSVYLGIAGAGGTVHATGVDLPVSIYGGTGNYTIYGGDGGNTIYGGSGSDTIFGGAGSDTIHGGTAGGNHIYAGSGDATIWGDGGLSDPGNTIAGGNGSDTIHAGDGGDSITGGTGDDTIYGGQGADSIVGGSGNNEIYGGPGNNVVLDGMAGKNNWIVGGSAAGNHETIYGSQSINEEDDWLFAGSGTDTIYGGNGDEVIHGGSGTDILTGGTGLDEIYGGTGSSDITGKGVHDVLVGGSGQNQITPHGTGLASLNIWDYGGLATDPVPATDYGWDSPWGGPQRLSNSVGGFNLDSGVRLGENLVTEVEVYVTWDPNTPKLQGGTQWAANADYDVWDHAPGGDTLLGSFSVDQNEPPPNQSFEPNDRPWRKLGVWDIATADTLTVELHDAAPETGDNLCMGQAMIHCLWPTVHVRADLDGTGSFGERDDYLAACNPAGILIEGQGNRMPVQLSATIPCGCDRKAVLPNVSGLEFWTDSKAGSRLTPDPNDNDNIIDQPSASYTREVWVSNDPTVAFSPTLQAINFLAEAELGDPTPVTATGSAPVVAALTFDQECALLSNAAYDPAATLPPGWTIAGTFTRPSGMNATLYLKSTTGQYVLAFKGTTPTNADDLGTDLQQLSGPTPQYTDALDLARQLSRTYRARLTFTGHSLGGGLASMAALSTQRAAIVFNAAPLSKKAVLSYWALGYNTEINKGGTIVSYFVKGELLSNLQENLSKYLNLDYSMVRVGSLKPLNPPSGVTSPLELHLMTSVLKAMGL